MASAIFLNARDPEPFEVRFIAELFHEVLMELLEPRATNPHRYVCDSLIGADAEKTNEAVTAFAAEFEKAVNARVKEALKSKTPKGGSAAGAKGITKEEIMKIKNPLERQKMIAAHPEAFK